MKTSGKSFLVTGANGFVGRRLCAEIRKRGGMVKAVLRRQDSSSFCDESEIVGEINDQTNWEEALSNVNVVLHLAACVHVTHSDPEYSQDQFNKINVEGTKRLALAAAAHGIKRLVYVSSIKVNGEATQTGNKFVESDIPAPHDSYAISKWEAEQALHGIAADTGLEVVIVRPPLVYGPGVKANFLMMLKVLVRGMPLPFGSVANLRSLIYVENLVDALIVCATHQAAAGQTYLVCDGEDIATPDLLRLLGDALGCSPRLFSFPPAMVKLAGVLTGRSEQVERLLGSLQIDSSKIRHELKWIPPHTLQQGLQETAAWYLTQASGKR